MPPERDTQGAETSEAGAKRNGKENTTNGSYVQQSLIHTGALISEVQQPPAGNSFGTTGRIPASAQKISGTTTRLARDVENPVGYHQVSNYKN